MSYRLSQNELVGESIRRIVCEEIEDAIEATKNEASDDCSPVHETRRHLKRARAALRLVRTQINRHAYKREDRRLRNVARLISDVRDAEVRLATVKQLRAHANARRSRTFQETEELLAFELDNFLAAFAGWEEETSAKLIRAQKRIGGWRLAHVTTDDLCLAIRQSYKRGRDALAVTQEEQNATSLHELRKRVKTLGYQLRILRPLDPAAFHDMLSDLKTLGEKLGHAHDLCFLAERLRSIRTQRVRRRGQRALENLIETREADLQRSALLVAERFFESRPAEFAKRVAFYFDNWKPEPANNFKSLAAAA